jgi:hypothetical protein
MQINFFIVFGLVAPLGTKLNRSAGSLRPCRTPTFATVSLSAKMALRKADRALRRPRRR